MRGRIPADARLCRSIERGELGANTDSASAIEILGVERVSNMRAES
jgi:hypothetical protein